MDSGGSDFGWVYLHQGGRWHAQSGMYHFRHRDYDPVLGRWVQQAPSTLALSLSQLPRPRSDWINGAN